MRYCGIDVSARPTQQQLCTLHPRRAGDGSTELVATFYEPGDVAAVARTVLGFGRVDGFTVYFASLRSSHKIPRIMMIETLIRTP